jgi:predicted Zn-dependent protease with MMP-like domain
MKARHCPNDRHGTLVTCPPKITLFRQPLPVDWEESDVGLDELIRHVTIHEAGHHFGFSDDDMHLLEEQGS